MPGRLLKDPRHFQIGFLFLFLVFGVSARAFEISLTHFAAIIGVACAAQWLGSLLIAARPDFRSAIITSLSLTLLLRADSAWPLMCAAAIAVGSKFAIRFDDKHIFNPANIGIVAIMLATDAAWTTPGQWGTAIWLALLLAGMGMVVTYRAARFDVPLIFLATFAALLFGRALWLGDPLSIPLLRLQSGALILFAFFMISDPKTTPDAPFARAVFSIAVAGLAYMLIFHYHISDGIFYALAAITLIRPVIEHFNPAPHYQWGDPVDRSKLLAKLRHPKQTPPSPAPAE